MPKACYRGLISATSKKEALKILDVLTKEKLVAGGLITSGISQYWWDKKRVTKTYWNLSIFTNSRNHRRISARVREIEGEEVPIIAFFKIDAGDPDFLDWVHTSLS